MTKTFNKASQVDLNKVTRFPVVVKPVLSRFWCEDHWLETQVQVAQNRGQLKHLLGNTEWLKQHPFMLQEFIEGYGAGLFALYDKGKPAAYFAHKRLREKPPEGGVSVLSCSVELSPSLLDASKKLLEAVNWHGVAMVEFRVSSEGTPYLMEVNTRFWGTLQLAIDAGVDFPALLLDITRGKPLPMQPEYRIGQKLRWLLGDFDSLYLFWRSSHFSFKQKITRTAEFFRPGLGSTRHQVGRFGDFAPGWCELKQYLLQHLAKPK